MRIHIVVLICGYMCGGAPAAQEEIVVAELRDGTYVKGGAGAPLTLATSWGRIRLPWAALGRLELSPFTAGEVEDLPRLVNRTLGGLDAATPEEREAAERDLIRLGALVRDQIPSLLEVSFGEKRERLARIWQGVAAAPMPPLQDSWRGPGISARGFIADQDLTVGGSKLPIRKLVSLTRQAEYPQTRVQVRMTDGTMLAGDFDRGTLEIDGEPVDLSRITSIVVDAAGRSTVHAGRERRGSLDGRELALRGSFGEIKLPCRHLSAVMGAWSPAKPLALHEAGWILDWLLFGPLPMRNGDDLEQNHIEAADEGSLAPAADETLAEQPWRAYHAASGTVWFSEAFADQGVDQVVAYGVAYVRAEKTAGLTLEVQSDDGVRVWLNGALVHSNHVHRGIDATVDRAGVTLVAGWNRLVVKVDNGWGPAGWRVRFTGGDSKPAAGLSVTLEPPPIFRGR